MPRMTMSTPEDGLALSSRATPEELGQAIPQPSLPAFGLAAWERERALLPAKDPRAGSWGAGGSHLEGAGAQGGGDHAISMAL